MLFDPHMEAKKYTKRLLLYKGHSTRQVSESQSDFQSALSDSQTLQMMRKMVLDFKGHQNSNLLILDLQLVFFSLKCYHSPASFHL